MSLSDLNLKNEVCGNGGVQKSLIDIKDQGLLRNWKSYIGPRFVELIPKKHSLGLD